MDRSERVSDSSATFSGPAEVIRPRWGPALLTLAGLLIQACVAVVDPTRPLAVKSALCLLPLGALVAQLTWSRAHPRRRRGELRFDGRRLTLEGRPVVRAARIESAYAPLAGEPAVRIVLRTVGSMDVHMESAARADELIAALDFPAGHSTAIDLLEPSGPLGVVVQALLFTLFIACGVIVAAHSIRAFPAYLAGPAVAFALFGGFALAAAAGLATFHRIHVGSDGILLRRVVGSRFTGYENLASVAVRGENLALGLRSGMTFRVRAAGTTATERRENAKALAARIDAARRAFLAADSPTAASSVLARGARDADRWEADLRGLVRTGDYRAVVDPSTLWRVVEDPAADPTSRAGAAFVLTSNADVDAAGRARIRLAALGCAEPRLRVALERLADDETREGQGILSSLSSRGEPAAVTTD